MKSKMKGNGIIEGKKPYPLIISLLNSGYGVQRGGTKKRMNEI